MDGSAISDFMNERAGTETSDSAFSPIDNAICLIKGGYEVDSL